MSDFQWVREDRVAVKVGVVYIGWVHDQMNQSKNFWREDSLVLSGRPGVWWIEEPDEDDVLWLAMTMVEVKKLCGVQVLGHSKDVEQWWIWLSWRTWDEEWLRNDWEWLEKGWDWRICGLARWWRVHEGMWAGRTAGSCRLGTGLWSGCSFWCMAVLLI